MTIYESIFVTQNEKAISDVASPDNVTLGNIGNGILIKTSVKTERSLSMRYGGFILEKLLLYYNQSELIRNDHA